MYWLYSLTDSSRMPAGASECGLFIMPNYW